MAILCPRCGHEYDVTLFSFGSTVRCDCGADVSLEPGHTRRAPARLAPADREARRGMEEIARGADAVVDLILDPEVADVDVDIAIERLRDRAEALFPGRARFFRRIYDARFARLRAQWRRGT